MENEALKVIKDRVKQVEGEFEALKKRREELVGQRSQLDQQIGQLDAEMVRFQGDFRSLKDLEKKLSQPKKAEGKAKEEPKSKK